MANIFDYIDWRGDLPLSQSPLNEVDCLVFSWLIYAPFDGLIPDTFDAKPVTLKEASDKFFETHDLDKCLKNSVSFTRTSALALKKLAESKRFGNLLVADFEKITDMEDETQFAAATILTEAGYSIVTFRGTDDTIIGWKEDFNMCFTGEVPAQRKALEYLEKAAANTKGTLVVCGHSKGGNLAVYSSCKAKSSVRKRVKDIYNFDGPGFGDRTDLGVGKEETFKKVHSFVPEQSIVGMLLDHDNNYTVVRSDGEFIFQHDAGTWQVKGTHFETLERVDKYSAALDDTIKNWILALSEEERAEFVNVLFGVVFTTSSRTLEDINADVFSFATETLKTYSGLPKETRNMVKKIVSMFFKSGSETLKRNAKLGAIEKKEKMTLAKAITKKAVK